MNAVPAWLEALVALLLLASGLLSLVGALGLVRLKNFFQRMHPPAMATSFGSWCVALASIFYFSALDGRLSLHAWLIAILLAITAPVTTTLLARAALFRRRAAAAAATVSPLREPESE
ncbi:MAG: Na+/H+ antiporter subunit G [Caldimonas sp.]